MGPNGRESIGRLLRSGRPRSGFSGVSAAFAVGLKQMMPAAPIVKGLKAVTMADLPAVLVCLALLLPSVGLLPFKEAPLVCLGTFVCQ